MNRNRPLTYEELVHLAENLSEIEDLTNGDEDNVSEEFEEEHLRAEADAQDEDYLEQEGNESYVSKPDDVSETIITEPHPDPSHVKLAAPNKQAVKDYIGKQDLTPKDIIGWRKGLQYITTIL